MQGGVREMKKTRQILIRLSQEEYMTILSNASWQAISIPEYLRRLAVKDGIDKPFLISKSSKNAWYLYDLIGK